MLSKKILVSIPNSIRTIRRLSAKSLHSDLTFQQFRILALSYEGMSQTQMSQNLQVSMAAISKMVDLLVKRGLLIRETCEDRRCLKLKLSPEGARIRKTVATQVEKVLDKNLSLLTNEEHKDLKKGLDVLDKLMGFVNEK